MHIMSEYFGMDHSYQNKYENLPRYLLAKKEKMRDNSKSDINHIGADGKSTNRIRNTDLEKEDSVDSEKEQQKFEKMLMKCKDLDSV